MRRAARTQQQFRTNRSAEMKPSRDRKKPSKNRSTVNAGKNAGATIPCGTGILACVGFEFFTASQRVARPSVDGGTKPFKRM
jgi:hypothetical protein